MGFFTSARATRKASLFDSAGFVFRREFFLRVVTHALPDERRAELVKAMVDAGFADRVEKAGHQPGVLGSDHCPVFLTLRD